MVVSYAQNAEDVRLWRVFAAKADGFYVDIGAGDPLVDSVTKLFYDAGWCGINIEPGPRFDALAVDRPRDVNLRLAIAAVEGEQDLWVTDPDPGLSSLDEPDTAALPPGFTASRQEVAVCRLETVLMEHAPNRQIDFLKIDVEGAERSVLESFDLRAVRPTVVVVEAIAPLASRPTRHVWEELLLGAEYAFAAFDGINCFYVARETSDLVPAIAYPVSLLDRFVTHDKVALRSELDDAILERDRLASEAASRYISHLEVAARESARLAREMEETLSWRVTRPLRAARRLQQSLLPNRARPGEGPASMTADRDIERAVARRLGAVRAALRPARGGPGAVASVEEELSRLEESLHTSRHADSVNAWLALAAVDGAYPPEDAVDAATRWLRARGPRAFVESLRARFEQASEETAAGQGLAGLRIVERLVVIDASHTITTDHQTGIQRVVRETLSRWVASQTGVRLAVWDDDPGALLLLAESEAQRISSWRDQMHESGAAFALRMPEHESASIVVPLDCHLVVPELPHPARSRGLRGLVRAGIHERLSLIGFDLVPVVGAETAAMGMAETFCEFLSLVKHADRLSAISDGTADSFRAFNVMVAAEGLAGPEVQAHSLPTQVPEVTESEIARARETLEVSPQPIVLVVGSHEPRKNHLAVLEAAERLWSRGVLFELLMIGGGEWRSDEFRAYADRLRESGRPINVRRRATDTELWAAYRIARFTVFPSLIEGFGLPVAESLASGTPVITSSHGSMAEIAADGGALLVDARKVDDIEAEMRRLLTDDELLERLRSEARARHYGTWDSYAHNVWEFFTSKSSVTS